MKRTMVMVVCMLVLFSLAFVACGGGGKGNSGGGGGGGGVTTSISQGVFSTVPGWMVASKHTTSSVSLFGQNVVYAQSTVSLTGNYNAFCLLTPVDRFSGLPETEFVMYGMGRWDPTDCGNNWQSITNDGAPVVGAGTLQNLVVVVSDDVLNTQVGNSGVVKVYKNPGNVFTGITCTISPTGNSGTPGCRDFSHTSAVQDAGSVYVTGTVNNGDKFHNIRVFLGKV